MASRDRGFAEFVEARGPVLWRMASLLEVDSGDAERLLVECLAGVRRRWSSLARDGAAEHVARQAMASSFVATHRRDDTLEVSTPLQSDVTPQRAALSALTAGQRVLLVLPTYAGASESEVSGISGVPSAEVAALTAEAEAQFRRPLAADITAPLLSILDAAALREVPPDLTASVLAATPPRRRGRVVAAASVVVLAIVVGVAMSPLGGGSDPAGAQPARGEWGLPAEIQVPADVPSLDESPVDQASAALVVDGTPVVVDAATGEVRAVLDPSSDLASKPSDRGAHGVIRQNWSQVVLSPDGQWLLMVRPRPGLILVPGGRARSVTGELFLVSMKTGDVTPVAELNPTPDANGVAGIAQPRLAWAPNSASFACACSGTLSIGLVDDSGLAAVNHTARIARAVAWGSSGLAVSDAKGGWSYTDQAAADTSPFLYSASIAITREEPTMYFEVSALTIYALGADKQPDGGHCTLWDAEFSYPRSVLSAAERGGTLCTPMTLQPGRDGFVLVLPGTGSNAADNPFDVVVVGTDGSSNVMATVPRETTGASFAAELVG